MNTCSTCKHWTFEPDGHGGRGECSVIKHVDHTVEMSGQPMAWIEPGEYCDVSFMTTGDFGCVKFEANDGI